MAHETRILLLTRTQRYGIAVLGVILAALLRVALDPLLGADLPLFLFIFPIIAAAWYGGLWPGLFATALSLLIGDYLFILPRGFLHEDFLSTQRLLILAFTGTLASILCDRMRKAIKAQLECLERYGILVETVTQYAIFTTDPQGRITCWNAGAERITGYSGAEILGRDLSSVPASGTDPISMYRPELEMVQQTGRFESEGWQTRKDGSRFWASSIITALRNDAGELRGFAKVMRDMTAPKETYDVMERAQRFVQNVIDVSPSMIYIFDIRQRRNVFVNRGTASGLGYTESQVSAADFVSTVMDPDCWKPFLEHLDRLATLGDEETSDFEYRMRHANGDWRWLHSRDKVFTRNSDGSVREIIGAATDITNRKNAEEKKRFMMELSQAMSPLAAAEEIVAVAMRMLVEFLGVDRADYADVGPEADYFVVLGEYVRGAAPSLSSGYCTFGFGLRERHALRDGRPYVVNDIDTEPQDGTDLSPYQREGIRAAVCVPLTKDREFVSRLAVAQNAPRRWTNDEISLITAVANRCWESVERARATKRLKESDDRYRAFVANSSEGIWRYELDEPVPVTLPEDEQVELFYQRAYLAECNEAFARTHGYSSVDEILGQRLTVLLVRLNAEKAIEYSRAFVRSGYRLIEAESRELDANGNTGYFVSSLVGVVENGALLRAWGTQREITLQKQAEAALRESEARFSKAFRASPNALVISRVADGVVLEVNDAFESLSGYGHDELIGKSTVLLGLYVNSSDRVRAVRLLEEQGRVRDLEFQFRRKTGEVRLLEFSAEPFDLHGENCWLTICRDISESKKIEREREQLLEKEKALREEAQGANRMKDEFLATISHELRTPLTSILGWVRLINRKAVSESQTPHALEVIERSAELQARLVDDILDTSRIITGRFNLEASPVDIARVFQAAVEVIRPSAEAKKISLRVAIDDGASTTLGDASRIQQIIWNLLSNAVKFTDVGGRIDARLKRVEEGVEIFIRDNGIGIEPQFLPHVFDRFRQADSSSTRKYSGLGLGLTIVRYLVEAHGGHVSAWSRGQGLGSTFKVVFPLAISARSPQTEREAPKRLPERPARINPPAVLEQLKGVRILAVEDDPETLNLLKVILMQREAEVTTAASVNEALEVLEHSQIDMLVSDLAMPDRDGYDLIREVRSRPPERGGTVPAIALSAYTRTEDRTRAIAAGFQLHLSKPVDPADLVRTVARLIPPRDINAA